MDMFLRYFYLSHSPPLCIVSLESLALSDIVELLECANKYGVRIVQSTIEDSLLPWIDVKAKDPDIGISVVELLAVFIYACKIDNMALAKTMMRKMWDTDSMCMLDLPFESLKVLAPQHSHMLWSYHYSKATAFRKL